MSFFFCSREKETGNAARYNFVLLIYLCYCYSLR